MGIISPYATGPAPIYYASGYIKGKEFWLYGLIFGIIFFISLCRYRYSMATISTN